MSFANPAGLWLALLALPVLALHILRPRRDEVEVSSVYLWRGIEATVSAARPWQRLRPSLLLALQLLVVAGLALAVARPVRLTDAPGRLHPVRSAAPTDVLRIDFDAIPADWSLITDQKEARKRYQKLVG